jgi:CHAT domain-containing protein
MSLWQVSDEVSKDLMAAYYTRLMAKAGRTEALQRVQLEILGGGKQVKGGAGRGLSGAPAKEAYSHPFYWAAFIQSGDWRPMSGK